MEPPAGVVTSGLPILTNAGVYERLADYEDHRGEIDLLVLAERWPDRGIVAVIRRRTGGAVRAALFRLLERAGEADLQGNINVA